MKMEKIESIYTYNYIIVFPPLPLSFHLVGYCAALERFEMLFPTKSTTDADKKVKKK